MGYYTTYIAGIKFHPGGHEYLSNIPEGNTDFALIPEPDNEYDANAIQVLHVRPAEQPLPFHLGYIPARMCLSIGQVLREGRIERVVKKIGAAIEIHYSPAGISDSTLEKIDQASDDAYDPENYGR